MCLYIYIYTSGRFSLGKENSSFNVVYSSVDREQRFERDARVWMAPISRYDPTTRTNGRSETPDRPAVGGCGGGPSRGKNSSLACETSRVAALLSLTPEIEISCVMIRMSPRGVRKREVGGETFT